MTDQAPIPMDHLHISRNSIEAFGIIALSVRVAATCDRGELMTALRAFDRELLPNPLDDALADAELIGVGFTVLGDFIIGWRRNPASREPEVVPIMQLIGIEDDPPFEPDNA